MTSTAMNLVCCSEKDRTYSIYLATQPYQTVFIYIYVTSSGSENTIMVMSC